MKLTQEDFDTLQDGLDALMEREADTLTVKERKALIKRIRSAENALVEIGIY